MVFLRPLRAVALSVIGEQALFYAGDPFKMLRNGEYCWDVWLRWLSLGVLQTKCVQVLP